MFLITRISKRWVINCRRDDLMKKDANYLYNQCRMCDEHFDASQFMDPASKCSLVWDAIPTIFPVRNPQHLLTPKRKAPTHRAPPIGLQEPGPSVVVTIRCQLRINVIRQGTVHRKMATTVFINCVLCVNLDFCLICWALYFILTTNLAARVCVCVRKMCPISALTPSFLLQTSRIFFSHSKIPIRCLWTAFCVPLSYIFLRKTIL